MKRSVRSQKSIVSIAAGICMVMGLISTPCHSTPSTTSIQGLLEKQDGSPLTGARAYQVRFFDAETAGSQVGSNITGTIEVSNAGRFNIVITPPAEILSLDNVWYEISVDSAPTPDNTIDANDVFVQRVKLNSVPFALKSDKAEHAESASNAEHAAQVEHINTTPNGNVGIGTSNPQYKLDVFGTTAAKNLILNEGVTIGPGYSFFDSAGNGIDTEGLGDLKFYVGGNSTGGIASDKVIIQASGSVGIGTKTPTGLLDVEGTIVGNALSINYGIYDSILHANPNTGNVGIGTNRPQYKLDVFGSAAAKSLTIDEGITIGPDYSIFDRNGNGIDTQGNGDLKFHAGGNSFGGAASDKMIIQSNGNVGIGTTMPSAMLHILSGQDVLATFQGKEYANGRPAVMIMGDEDAINPKIYAGSSSNLHLGNTSVGNALTIRANGSVGIGTDTPFDKLHVNGNIRIGAGGRIFNTSNNGLSTQSNGDVIIHAGSGAPHLFVKGSGNVGIGTSSPAYKLHVNGYAKFTDIYTDIQNTYSDINLKENIVKVDKVLDNLSSINGYRYTLKSNKRSSIGVIAQEIEQVFPELVTDTDEGIKSVNYNGLIPVLIEAIKEQQAQIETLKDEVETLKATP